MAGKKERQRKLARERLERQQQRRAQRAHRLQQRAAIGGAAVAVAGIAVGIVFLFGGFGSGKSVAASPTTTPSATATPTPTQPAEPATRCTYTSNPPASRSVGEPPTAPVYTATYQATIHTNRGVVVINLLNSKATCTVNSFVYLAGKNYFNNTQCHRLTTSGIYVLQCGDPTGKGTGGPGYEFGNENTAGASYPQGTVAMANTGAANSNGSQFFLVYKNTSLPASYTPFGTIVAGLDIVENVAKAGSDNSNGSGDGHPKEKVVIESVAIKKT